MTAEIKTYFLQKIISYLVASSMVIILLVVSIFFTGNVETMQMSSQAGKLVPIYSVDTQKQRIALTINCAWSQYQMG